ncbi:uncharacterized protein LOC131318748 isoform X1 [Rhododendron vialii]|uniref:uncharacterized protein LOC131318748 isoform X1 n=1 Tax=Rhododendron vialii TaxID=182163 RepID=UPI00265E753B|nr:uncharacterized protein LOC131318748 isoform X1 [Rhododendron vialii]
MDEQSKYSSGQLETSKSERAVWLMKCPPVVSRSLQCPPPLPFDAASSSSSISSGPVAKVVVSIDPLLPIDDPSSRQFTMELAATESGNLPKCYSMDMSTDFVPMSVFSESSQGKLSVEGKIYHKFDMKPHNENIEQYGKLCRERTKKYMTKNRQIQVIDNDNGTRMLPLPGMIGLKASGPSVLIPSYPFKNFGNLFMIPSFLTCGPVGILLAHWTAAWDKKKVPAKGSDMKRTRRDRGEMEEIMFKLFERQPNWTLKQLLHETDQPEQFLKDLLKDLCVYNNKGIHQGTYELKPEYKKSVGEPESV